MRINISIGSRYLYHVQPRRPPHLTYNPHKAISTNHFTALADRTGEEIPFTFISTMGQSRTNDHMMRGLG